ncbi:MAG TPA: hypothetical protein VFS20_31615 [Longimicrobium sp.]|nr:hypothetical protein [Longimicrobium sp.]
MKWTKCPGSSAHPLYLLGATIIAGRAKYKCIVIDRRLVDNAMWNDGDRELGYFKAWWTLLLSRVQPGWLYRVRLDALNLQRSGRLQTLRDTLNAAAIRDRGLDYPCCESVEPRDSKKDDLIPVVDLLTGAVGFHYAGGHLAPGASRGKIELAERICTAFGKPSLVHRVEAVGERLQRVEVGTGKDKSTTGTLTPIRGAETRKLVTEFGSQRRPLLLRTGHGGRRQPPGKGCSVVLRNLYGPASSSSPAAHSRPMDERSARGRIRPRALRDHAAWPRVSGWW